MAKRGRKRKHYFGPEEEAAVVKYLQCDDEKERNEIYNEWLRKPLVKMVESILRTYKLQREGWTHEEMVVDALSHLNTKMYKFNPKKNKKAYSYFSAICKNHLLGGTIKEDKMRKKNLSFEDVSASFEDDEEYSYTLPENEYSNSDLISDICDEIEEELDAEGLSKKKMNDNERKLGVALIDVLGNREEIFGDMQGGSKYDKNRILETLRNYTGLSTKDIRIAMKRYKKLYGLLKMTKIREGYI